MNGIINKFLLAEDNFMPDMHLRQAGFTYSADGPFTKNKERMQKFKETGDGRYIYPNKLDKVCFQHDMVYGDFKDLPRRTASDKLLSNKAFNIAKTSKDDGYQRELASVVYKCFDKKTSGVNLTLADKFATKNEIMSSQDLAEELHNPIIRKVYTSFKGNTWGVYYADMQLISKFNKRFRFLLYSIDIYSKYAWFPPSKDKKFITITNAFPEILDESGRKPNKIWVDKLD